MELANVPIQIHDFIIDRHIMESPEPFNNEKKTRDNYSVDKVDQKLHHQTMLGYVHLTIADLERSISFYRRSLGFQVHRRMVILLFLVREVKIWLP